VLVVVVAVAAGFFGFGLGFFFPTRTTAGSARYDEYHVLSARSFPLAS
jgi:hypothetical protein